MHTGNAGSGHIFLLLDEAEKDKDLELNKEFKDGRTKRSGQKSICLEIICLKQIKILILESL